MDSNNNRTNENKSDHSGYTGRRTVPLRYSRTVSDAHSNPQNPNRGEFSARKAPGTGAYNKPASRNAPERRREDAGNRESRRLLTQKEMERRRKALLKRRNRIFALFFVALFIVVLLVTKLVVSLAGNQSRTKYEINENPKSDQAAMNDLTETDNTLPTVTYPSDDGTAKELNIDSEYGILISLSDNKIVASKKGTEKIYPASMTKIMTLIAAVENISDIEKTTFTFSSDILSDYFRENASVAGFKAGETVSVKDMLYGLILPSGADAAAGIARCVSGSEEAFVDLMNQTAERIGLVNTRFTNPVGLHDDGMFSTCLDIAVLLEYAIQNPTCLEVLSTYKYTTAKTEQNPEGIELTSTLFSRMEGGEPETARIYAGKTGYTEQGLNCLASYAKSNSDGSGYIMVTAKGSSIWKPIFDAINTYKEFIK